MTEPGAVRVAVMQATGIVGDASRNLATVEKFAHRATARGAELLVTPELFASGYGPAAVADDDGSRHREQLAAVARSAGVAIVASTVDHQDGERFISASLFDRNGRELSRYHKAHLFGAAENAFFTPGRLRPQVVELRGVRVALGICFDVEFPEFVRDVALSGAELLCVPTAVPLRVPVDGRPAPFDTRLVPGMVVPTRALESQIFIAYANHAGPTFAGLSCLSDPYGKRVAAGESGEALVVGEVSRHILRAARHDTDYLSRRG
ncbi:nitrilase-related carbon-nitrogen hydrolase [Streptomyces sp. LHD-70]|uniref:nitrilase-related carbon-nitrogen hydrolase n=1 Tax=Streptomyces sp. LHD-70 TaxID=3072140 RepID=UPI00280CF995|nr:nitrilase-related carbon-nitrogen hydrolase [Streptomyces sp. LHD-70]MDQ8702534.1 nitrilase-related carbon-nitrogen hydrolase [Streptomyces sp. LHD-70]